jgi:UDP-N-acetylenolpyruvoylglucosamine reductase
MEDRIKLLITELGQTRIKENLDIAEHLKTSKHFTVRLFYLATTVRELIKAIEAARDLQIEYMVLGSGSKSAFLPEAYDGLIIKNRTEVIKIAGVKGKVTPNGIDVDEAFVEADSGISVQKLIEFAKENKLGGMDNLKGEFGTIGGSLFVSQNLQFFCHQIKILAEDGAQEVVVPENLKRDDIVLSATFKFKAAK